MTNYRQLCSELVDAYAWCVDNYMSANSHDDSLVQRARAALAEPELEGPTDEELDAKWGLPAGTVASWGAKPPPDVAAAISRQLDRDIARAVLARRGATTQ